MSVDSPRLLRRHQRHSAFARLRYGRQEKSFLAKQATRLSSTATVVFGKVTKYTAGRVVAAANLAAIP